MKNLIFTFCAIIFASCTTLDVFEKSTPFPSQNWNSNNAVSVDFAVTDTNSLHNFYLVLRHTEKYPYKNIWLQLTIKSPNDTSVIKREFTLADNSKWLGATIDDITDHRIMFNPQPIKLKKGNYNFTIKQIMRENPLPHILSAGIRVQKIAP
jgi:gliding motility-associated lipoprotein GldH